LVFSSAVFLVFFLPILLAIYYLTPKKYKNIVLLVFSIVFYAWGAPKFIFVILSTTFLDFHLVNWMERAKSESKRKLLLSISVCINLGLLGYFKYMNFFIDNFNSLFSYFGFGEIPLLNLVMPIGISFYTFETITYVVDVYRKIHKPLPNFWDYQLYIILFPKLIAGPIVRYHEISDQITDRSHNDTFDNKLNGFLRFSIGLAKKVLIANTMGEFADMVFATPTELMNSSTVWLGVLAYTFQIYYDFSGYSDMALGIGLMLGFKFPENFMNPYISQSITEFWRRWHITLGNWMKNYLYIPLGGNKVGKKRLLFNLFFVFIVSGFWHGAAWTFILWGIYHGVFLVLDRLFLKDLLEKSSKFISIPFTFFVVMIGWVLFRADSTTQAFALISKMFSFDYAIDAFYYDSKLWFVFALASFFAFFCLFPATQKIQNYVYLSIKNNTSQILFSLLSIVLFFLSLSAVLISDFNPFIYFRF